MSYRRSRSVLVTMAVQGGAIMDDGPLGGAAPAKVVGADAAGNEEPAKSKSPKKPKATAATLEDGAAEQMA